MSTNIATQNLLISPGSKFLSVMIPTRNRFDKLKHCLDTYMRQIGEQSLRETEFIINFDSDDSESIARIGTLPFDKVDIKVIISDKLGGYKDLFHFYNQCARVASGRFLLMWNDDATFKTENWYEIFKTQTTAETSAYSYWFGGTPSTVVEPGKEPRIEDWPCFIAHHRLLYSIIGFYGHQGGVDSFLYYVLGPLGVLKKIESIHVDHLAWFQIPLDQRDTTTKNNAEEGAMLPTNFEVVKYCQQKIVDYTKQSAPPIQWKT